MELRPDRAKVVKLLAQFDSAPVESAAGPVLWANVEIEYCLAGFSPTVTIRLPLSFDGKETQAHRRSQALRDARLLIDHACRAVGIEPTGISADQA